MTVLFPPVLESQGRSIPFIQRPQGMSNFLEIRFALPAMLSRTDFKHIQVSLKNSENGRSAVDPTRSPDRATIFINAVSDNYFFGPEESTDNYLLKIPYECFENGYPASGVTYLVQVRFGAHELWPGANNGFDGSGHSSFARWRQMETTNVPSGFGEWSNTMKVYCYPPYSKSGIQISYDDFTPQIIWEYRPTGDDALEQVKIMASYQGFNNELMIKDYVFNGQWNGGNEYSVKVSLDIAPVVDINLTLEAVTKNNTVIGDTGIIHSLIDDYSTIRLKQGKLIDPEKETDYLNGCISRTIQIPDSVGIDSLFSVYRVETLSLNTIKIVNKENILHGEDFTFEDYTVEMGEDYQYVVAECDSSGKVIALLTNLKPFGPNNPAYARLMRMEYSFLTDKYHQLKFAGDVSVSNFKRNTQDAFQTTIGGKYPFYTRASAMNYRTLTLSGLITINFDENATFMRLDIIGKMKIGDILTVSEYGALISVSPGCEQFFTETVVNDNRVYRLTGRPTKDFPMSQDQIVGLVNRCTTTIIKNGLWWEDDEGSQLVVQDRDLIGADEFSLSRRRFLQNNHKVLPGAQSNYGQYLQRDAKLSYGTQPTDALVYTERKFREKVMEWLSNGKPKLFRSETEGDMIVMVSGASFTPYQKSGRMVYSVSCTLTEIAAFTSQNLFLYDLVPSKIKSVCLEINDFLYTWGKKDPQVVTDFQFVYSDSFDIPNMRIDDEYNVVSINLSRGIRNQQGTVLYTALDTLPPGITLNPNTGKISGYPQSGLGADYQGPSTVRIMAQDKQIVNGITNIKGQATITINIGYIYWALTSKQSLSITGVNGMLKVGDSIQDITVTKGKNFTGGVPQYTFFGIGLPDGVSIDKMTGVISGYFTKEQSDGTAIIRVVDRMNQSCEIPVVYDESYNGLSFVKLPEFDRGYLEEKESIDPINTIDGVRGGKEPYKFYCTSIVYPIPDGLTINRDTGVVSGAPTKAGRAGQFEVKVVDATGDEATILINYNTILEEFYFEYTDTINVLWENGALKVLPLGTNIASIDVSKNVHGGLKFTNGFDYLYSAEGLLPNFLITQSGSIHGQAQMGKEVTEAYLYVEDARGKKVPVTKLVNGKRVKTPIKVSKITTSLYFLYNKIVIKNLKKGQNVNTGTVIKYHSTGSETGNSIKNNKAVITNGQSPYNISLVGGCAGISVKAIYAGDSEPIEWQFEGTANETFSGSKQGYLVVADSVGNKIQVPVIFEAVYDEMTWEKYAPYIVASPGAKIQYSINGISGGTPPYSISWKSGPNWVKENLKITTSNNYALDNWIFSGLVPSEKFADATAVLAVTDSSNPKVTLEKTVQFEAGVEALKVTLLNSMNDMNLIKNHSVLDKDLVVVEFSGGDPGTSGYKVALSAEVAGTILPSGFVLEKLNSNGSQWGFKKGTSPKETFSVTKNIAPYLSYQDGQGNGGSQVVGQVWYPPRVYDKPEFGAQVQKINNTSGALTATGLLINSFYTSPNLFEKVSYPGILVGQTSDAGFGDPPPGINFFKGIQCFLQGTVQALNSAGRKTKYDLEIPASTYTPALKMSVTITFDATSGPMYVSRKPDTLAIPALAINTAISEIDLSDCLSGGVGDFSWEADNNLPKGLTIMISDNGKKAKIVGTPTELKGETIVTITVTDNGSSPKTSKTFTLSSGGVYEPIKITPASITLFDGNKIDGNTPYEKTLQSDFGVTITGGYQNKVLLEDKDNALALNTGLSLSADGFISGVVTTESRNPATFYIYAKDSKGQEAKLEVKSPGVIGNLGWVAPTTPLIPSDEKGTVYKPSPAIDLSKYVVKGKGGTVSYQWPDEFDERSPQKQGFIINEDVKNENFETDGKIKSIRYPDEKKEAGSFYLKLTDSEITLYVEIKFGEVTDPDETTE